MADIVVVKDERQRACSVHQNDVNLFNRSNALDLTLTFRPSPVRPPVCLLCLI